MHQITCLPTALRWRIRRVLHPRLVITQLLHLASVTTNGTLLTNNGYKVGYPQLLRKGLIPNYHIIAGISSGINGMMQYQWGQGNLTASAGTAIQAPNTQGTNPDPSAGNSQSPAANSTGVSPNDGYTTSGTGQNGVENVRPSIHIRNASFD